MLPRAHVPRPDTAPGRSAENKVLLAQDSISKQQLDTQVATVHQLEGVIKSDQAQIDSAKLQLTYSRITAPITGRIDQTEFDPGNIVHASDQNGVAIITQMQPMVVLFTLPEDNLPQVLTKLYSGQHLVVETYDRDMTQKLATGTLRTIDNQIDPNTGTIKWSGSSLLSTALQELARCCVSRIEP